MTALPPGWVQVPLSELTRAEYGKGLAAADRRPSGGIPVYGSAGVAGHHDAALVDGPVVVVGRKGNAGACHVPVGACWPVDTTYFLRVPVGLEPKFLGYQLSVKGLRALDSSTAIPSLRRPALEGVAVSLPGTSEQRRIVAAIEEQFSRLDAADEGLRRASLKLRNLRQQAIDALIPADALELRVETFLAEPLANGRSLPTEEGGFPVLRLSSLRDGRVDLEVSKPGAWTASEAKPWLVRNGDFLVARGNGSLHLVGRGGLVEGPPPPVAFPDTLIRIRADERVMTRRYLRLAWDTTGVRAQIEAQARTTAGIYKVNQGMLQRVHFGAPAVAEQGARVAVTERRLSLLDAMRAAIASAEQRSAALRRSILERAFRGELVPQDPSDEPASVLLERIRAERAAQPKPRRGRRAGAPQAS